MANDSQTTKIYGWYDRPDQPVDQPTFNPDFHAECPYCSQPITDEDVRTHSLMPVDESLNKASNTRAYFYRTHRTCDEMALPKARNNIDGKIFDMIKANHD